MKVTALLKNNKDKIYNFMFSIGATAVMNLVLQLFVYPSMAERLGAEVNGVALSMLSLVAIAAGACGTSANYSRMVNTTKLPDATNGDYNLYLLITGLICCTVGAVYQIFYLKETSPLAVLLFAALMFASTFRYYSDVQFRLKADFFRYFIFFLLMSAGYLLGLLVFCLTGQWMLAILTGECAGVLYVILRGTLYRHPVFRPSASFKPVCVSISLLLAATLVENLTFHADRLLLLALTDGTSVTVYYAASLIGKVVAMLTVPVNSLLITYLVRFRGKLSFRFWSVATVIALAASACAFGACMLVSPWFIRWKYSLVYEEAIRYVVPALLGQILFFVSGVLMVILLRFFGEKKQFLYNVLYAVEFFILVIVCTSLWGLKGFVWACMAANLIRLLLVVVLGYVGVLRTARSKENS